MCLQSEDRTIRSCFEYVLFRKLQCALRFELKPFVVQKRKHEGKFRRHESNRSGRKEMLRFLVLRWPCDEAKSFILKCYAKQLYKDFQLIPVYILQTLIGSVTIINNTNYYYYIFIYLYFIF